MNLTQISKCLSLPRSQDIEIRGFSIDTRQLCPGELFVAIKGATFDGQDFIFEAVNKGASAVLCRKAVEGLSIPQLIVDDPLQSLVELAKEHRRILKGPVIALTGSNGKTSVKEMIAAILPSPSLATKGNLNNHIGVPLSVLRLNASHRYAVFELGANHAGEIAHTVSIVSPDVALINNIAPAHIEGFGSVAGVARAKGEIYRGLKPGGTAVVNDDDDYSHFWDESLKDKKVLRFSLTKAADVYVRHLRFNEDGIPLFSLILPGDTIDVKLNVSGEHNVHNALAAAACCHAVGLSSQDIARGLQQFRGVSGRMTYLTGRNNALVIDDTYNANLRSTLTALSVLAARKSKRIFVFGDMGELGQWAEAHHEEVGTAARQLGIDKVFTYGNYSAFTRKAFTGPGQHYSNQEELISDLLNELDEETTVLVKGSRSSAMENVVRQLIDHASHSNSRF
ncbi:UDP-N-acetylmuramoyl-tripeptide--D-alanyl-D-alanine ligase [Legionella israelensis]|uniref:UDP-N-acetylmuramoyl-tripeptide--D-alanyl-D-alanine ligase n=1 Tax=Legionella israelensis TaxID=454 RepID=A0AAX1EE91_9GAMM|nr:UDP-N-acetylmuramoyl-tripeptide--D-alanyl-D-alanine ligase [Legionella israelensis]QBR83384.1 UDP-N-acetylmuramoyl-tripeptide--D-alanyl-D-alanine ligase [Legionella israelensis]